MTHTITVSIGRSLPAGGELSDDEWLTFRALTRSAVTAYTDDLYFYGCGRGVWRDPETAREHFEESYTVVAGLNSLATLTALRSRLATLAAAHQQDAISLTIGSTDLVSAPNGEPF